MLQKEPERPSAASDFASSPFRFFFAFLALFLATLALHATLLRLPYYWDEAGYYIPAAYDFFRTGTLIPFSTLTNAHPPALSLYLALLWKILGFRPVITRVGMALVSAGALTAVFAISQAALRSAAAAVAVTLMTAAYPVWFAQATLAQADGLAAAATLWGLYFFLPLPKAEPASGRRTRRSDLWCAGVCFTLAALTKEIAIGTPLALGGWEVLRAARSSTSGTRLAAVRRALPAFTALTAPVLPLILWFSYHHFKTGFTFGNPEYLRYNATATLSLTRFLLALGHRALHLTVHLNLFVPVLMACGSLLLPAIAGRWQIERNVIAQIWVVLVANGLLFSLLGGALLTRYLLPEYPLVLLLSVGAIRARFRSWIWFPTVSIGAFAAALLLPTPYQVAPEDTLAYRDAVVLEQEAISEVAQHYPHGAVLSAWPVTDGLRKPELGYVDDPFSVVAIDNFSLGALQLLSARPAQYSTAIVFSTKYDPPAPWLLPLRRWNRLEDTQYFAYHQDLQPETIATLLHGTVVWQARRSGQWAAVLRFAHPALAKAKLTLSGGDLASYNGQ